MTKRIGHRGYGAVNKKAEQKLDFVAQSLVAASGEAGTCFPAASGPLVRNLDLRCCPETGPLTIRYRPQSKLFAILYDFVGEFTVAGPPVHSCVIGMASGSTKLVDVNGGKKGGSPALLPALTDNGLIEERLRLLGATRVNAFYDDCLDAWRVSVSLMIGSATWNLLPPVMHLIEPSADECLRMLELFRLLAAGIRSS